VANGLAIVLFSAALVACAGNASQSFSVPDTLPRAGSELSRSMEALAPGMLAWVESVESDLLRGGRVLSARERGLARRVGVRCPGRVRLQVTATFPMPQEPSLREEAVRLGLDQLPESGRAMGYAILLKPGWRQETLVHELVHVAQMERLGRENFLRRYFAELDAVGYSSAPLERQARAMASRFGR